jgi:hypothetical protein
MTLNSAIQARYMFGVPWLGYALAFFTLRWVRTAMLALAALALIVGIVFHVRQDGRDYPSSAASDPKSCRAGGN